MRLFTGRVQSYLFSGVLLKMWHCRSIRQCRSMNCNSIRLCSGILYYGTIVPEFKPSMNGYHCQSMNGCQSMIQVAEVPEFRYGCRSINVYQSKKCFKLLPFILWQPEHNPTTAAEVAVVGKNLGCRSAGE